MKDLLQAVLARLDTDPALTGSGAGQLAARVFFDRAPDDPKTLTTPLVLLSLQGNPDRSGDHGGAVDVTLTVEVWGYASSAGADVRVCVPVCQRVDELLLKGITISGRRATARLGGVSGWQRVDDPDPLVIHHVATYLGLYWSTGRVTALTT